MHSGASWAQNIDSLFLMLGWTRHSLHKMCTGTRYVKLVLLHPVGSTGHVVHSAVSGARNIDTLFFMLGWDRYGLIKSASGDVTMNLCFCIQWNLCVTLCSPVRPGHETSTHYFLCSSGPSAVSIKSVLGHVLG
jgi:hypothetical protein